MALSVSTGLKLPDALPGEMLDAAFPDAEPRNAVHRCTWHGHEWAMRNYLVEGPDGRWQWALGLLVRRGDTVVLASVRDDVPGLRRWTPDYGQILLSLRILD